MLYQVRIAPRARREIGHLPQQIQARIIARLEALADNPRPSGVVQMAGVERLYRLRVGDYRAIYSVEDNELFVLVVKVGHRRDVYR
jgi:mRNA interferase RelE/StbE